MLKNVVFPAPFGPIRLTIDRSGIVKSRSLTAVEPAELLADALGDEEICSRRGHGQSSSRFVASASAWSIGSCPEPSSISSFRRRSGISPVGRNSIIITMMNP